LLLSEEIVFIDNRLVLTETQKRYQPPPTSQESG